MSKDSIGHLANLEADICALLSHQPGGGLIVGNLHFVRVAVEIGDERLTYFKVTMTYDRPIVDDGFATNWGRRITDVLPLAAPEKPSLRRKRVM